MNLDKSKLILLRQMENIQDLALELRCKVEVSGSLIWASLWTHHLNKW